MDEEAAEHTDFVINEPPDDMVDEAGNPLPACGQDELQVAIPPVSDPEGDGFFGTLLVTPSDECRQDYPYFRVVLRDARGQLLGWVGRLFYVEDPDLTDATFAHFGPVPCQAWEEFPAFVTVGYEKAPEGQVFRLGAHCQPPPESG